MAEWASATLQVSLSPLENAGLCVSEGGFERPASDWLSGMTCSFPLGQGLRMIALNIRLFLILKLRSPHSFPILLELSQGPKTHPETRHEEVNFAGPDGFSGRSR